MEWITDRLPTEEDRDNKNEVVVQGENGDPFYCHYSLVEHGWLWLQSSYFCQTKKFGEQSIQATGGRWITTRQPMELDGNKDGAVRVRKYPDREWGVNIHWSYVGTGVPWEHTNDYEGLIEPIPPEPTETQPKSEAQARTFASVKRTYVNDNCVIDAIASDGTFWCFVQSPGNQKVQWTQMPDLPQPQ